MIWNHKRTSIRSDWDYRFDIQCYYIDPFPSFFSNLCLQNFVRVWWNLVETISIQIGRRSYRSGLSPLLLPEKFIGLFSPHEKFNVEANEVLGWPQGIALISHGFSSFSSNRYCRQCWNSRPVCLSHRQASLCSAWWGFNSSNTSGRSWGITGSIPDP